MRNDAQHRALGLPETGLAEKWRRDRPTDKGTTGKLHGPLRESEPVCPEPPAPHGRASRLMLRHREVLDNGLLEPACHHSDHALLKVRAGVVEPSSRGAVRAFAMLALIVLAVMRPAIAAAQ